MAPNMFRAREARAPLVATVGVAVGLAAAQAGAAEVSGNAAIVTDYVWRGSTQTSGDAAVQAGFKVAGESGLYASLWGSNVEFAPGVDADAEFDLALGWSKALNDDWTIDVNVLRYQYPSASVDLNWTELNGTVAWKGDYWLSVGHSGQALGYDASGTYALLGARFPVNDAFRIEAAVAHYFLDDAVVARNGYTHGSLSAVWALRPPIELRLTAHATDTDAEAIFGADYAGSRAEAALQASF